MISIELKQDEMLMQDRPFVSGLWSIAGALVANDYANKNVAVVLAGDKDRPGIGVAITDGEHTPPFTVTQLHIEPGMSANDIFLRELFDVAEAHMQKLDGIQHMLHRMIPEALTGMAR
ncbi:MAG: hypothetical protein ABFD83_13810 [Armatimonadota bacterium]